MEGLLPCLEGGGEVSDLGAAMVGWPGNSYDIKSARIAVQAVVMEEVLGGPNQPVLFFPVHPFFGGNNVGGTPGFDFHKDDGSAIQSHQVQFPPSAARTSGQNPVTSSA